MADALGDEWWKEESSDEDRESEAAGDETLQPSQEESEPEKLKKKKRKRTRKRITDELREKGDNPASAGDVVTFLQKHFAGKLTPTESDEIKLDNENFFSSNPSPGFPVAYLRSILPKWKKLKALPVDKGSPVLLIICASALRAVDLNRNLQEFKGEKCRCAKLFAKHMKLEEQQKFLQKSVCHMGIGTPNRILALIKSGHLKLDKLVAIVIDWNWRDVKKHRVVDIPEIKTELAVLLQTYLIPHIKSQTHCKIGIL